MQWRFAQSYGPEVGDTLAIKNMTYFAKRGAVAAFDRRSREVRDDPLDGLSKETYRGLAAKMCATRGFFAFPSNRGPARGINRPGPAKIIHEKWDRSIRDIAATCDRTGVIFVVVFSPIVCTEIDARDFRQLESWAHDLESSQSNVRVMRPLVTPYDASLMYDSIHLNAAGVAKFMPVVATDVQATLK